MKKLIPFIACCFLIVSCKNDSKKQNNTEETPKEVIEKIYKDAELENALYDGYFIENKQGFDVSIYNGSIYLLKANPSEEERNNHFFLHVLPKKGDVVNLDFSPSEHLLNPDLSGNYSNTLVYKRELPEINGVYDINLGQFNDKGRSWENYILVDKLNTVDNKYNNDYVGNTKNNRYLKAFKDAFDQGYFMQHQDNFDLLLDNHTLYYIMTDGKKANLDNMFFLHVKFNGKEELINLDFEGKSYQIDKSLGKNFESFVVLKREIPNNGKVTELATGQFNKNGRVWSYVYEPEKLYNDMSFIYNGQYGEALK